MEWKLSVIKKIKPERSEIIMVHNSVKEFTEKAKKVLDKDTEVQVGGSIAKGTWLKGQHDADIFILFDLEKHKRNSGKLPDLLEKKMKKSFSKYERLHGSRDYFRINQNNITFEVVPILKIKKASESVNITDVSPLHARWVKKNSSRRMCDEIRLAKAFCKAQRCYGAESYVQGFSGYVLEILVIHYGGFAGFLKSCLKLKENEVIDAGGLYKNKRDIFMRINKAKLRSPIIVVDPVDKERNAAAALSHEKWKLFREKAGRFLKQPSERFFYEKKHDFEELVKRKSARESHIVWIEAESNKGKEDKIGAQLMLAFNFLKDGLKRFEVSESGWEWNKGSNAAFWFVLDKNELDKSEARRGPPAGSKEDVKRFKDKHKKTFEKEGVLWTEVKVKNYRLKDCTFGLLQKEYFKRRVNKVAGVKFSA